MLSLKVRYCKLKKLQKRKKKLLKEAIELIPKKNTKTLSQISTGKKQNKFGVNQKVFLQLVNIVKKSESLNLKCLSVHIGSQILSYKPYQKMLNVVNKIIKLSNYNFEYIDLGGGMGIDYNHDQSKLDFYKYSKEIEKFLKNNHCKIIFEPDRSIVGDSAILITKVIYINEGFKKTCFIWCKTCDNPFKQD